MRRKTSSSAAAGAWIKVEIHSVARQIYPDDIPNVDVQSVGSARDLHIVGLHRKLESARFVENLGAQQIVGFRAVVGIGGKIVDKILELEVVEIHRADFRGQQCQTG